MKKYFLTLVLGLICLPLVSSAVSMPCVAFTQYLGIGSSDARTAGEVTALQKLLVAKGYLTMPAGVSTGYYGNATVAAVRKFQLANGVSSLGFVGPATRAKLNACGTHIQPSSAELDTKTKSNLMGMRMAAELYYDAHGSYSSAANCNSGMFVDSISGMVPLTMISKYPRGTVLICKSLGTAWTASANLSNGTSWCVDNTGTVGGGKVDSEGFGCKMD